MIVTTAMARAIHLVGGAIGRGCGCGCAFGLRLAKRAESYDTETFALLRPLLRDSVDERSRISRRRPRRLARDAPDRGGRRSVGRRAASARRRRAHRPGASDQLLSLVQRLAGHPV